MWETIQLQPEMINEQLVELREARNLTQKDLARGINCSQNRISKIENHSYEDLSVRQLIDYAEGLNMNVRIYLEPK